MNRKKDSSQAPTPAPPATGAGRPGQSAAPRRPASQVDRTDSTASAAPAKDEGNSIFDAIRRVPGTVWIALIVAILVAAFVLQNQAKMDFELLWLDLTAPTWAVLAGQFVVGVLVGFLIRHRGNRKDKQK